MHHMSQPKLNKNINVLEIFLSTVNQDNLEINKQGKYK